MHTHTHTCSAPAPAESYRSNNKKEQLILSYAENFQRQFRQLYGDRKSLFLKPVNEYGVEVGTLVYHLCADHDCLLASFNTTFYCFQA